MGLAVYSARYRVHDGGRKAISKATTVRITKATNWQSTTRTMRESETQVAARHHNRTQYGSSIGYADCDLCTVVLFPQ